jgi:hypothetical protein
MMAEIRTAPKRLASGISGLARCPIRAARLRKYFAPRPASTLYCVGEDMVLLMGDWVGCIP